MPSADSVHIETHHVTCIYINNLFVFDDAGTKNYCHSWKKTFSLFPLVTCANSLDLDGYNLFDTLLVFLKEYFEKANFE